MNDKINMIQLEASFQNLETMSDKKVSYQRLARFSLQLVIAFLLLQFTLILLKAPIEKVEKKLFKDYDARKLRRNENLIGIQLNADKPKGSFQTFLSGQWQKEFERWFSVNAVPLRSKIIKLHNQIYYALFLKSYMNSGELIIGKNRYLYDAASIYKYYNLHRSLYPKEKMHIWANDLQSLANFFHRRGQKFIYIITPSKASYYPEYLPECKRCSNIPNRPDYKEFTSTLKKRGFKFIDASEMTLSAKKEFEPYLFPKGGGHWTQLASAFATRELMKQISEHHPLPELTFSYKIKPKADGEDADLARLLNLFSRPRSYPVPEVSIKPLTKKTTKPLKLAIISGSFMFSIAKILAETQLFDQIDFFFYWQVDHYRNTPHMQGKSTALIQKFMPFESLGINPLDPKAYDEIFSADVVILEENEPNLRSYHLKSLYQKIFGKPVIN